VVASRLYGSNRPLGRDGAMSPILMAVAGGLLCGQALAWRSTPPPIALSGVGHGLYCPLVLRRVLAGNDLLFDPLDGLDRRTAERARGALQPLQFLFYRPQAGQCTVFIQFEGRS
jgi:hypothetical protein